MELKRLTVFGKVLGGLRAAEGMQRYVTRDPRRCIPRLSSDEEERDDRNGKGEKTFAKIYHGVEPFVNRAYL